MIIPRGSKPNYIILNDMIKAAQAYDNIAIVCVGTDKNIGDSIGPIVGTKLQAYYPNYVHGTLKKPLHALNLEDFIKANKTMLANSFVIAIDATLSICNKPFDILIEEGPLNPGKGLNKKLPAIGNIKVCGIIGNSVYAMLHSESIRLYDIMDAADQITEIVATMVGLISKRSIDRCV